MADLDKRLIQQAKEQYLNGYHIDLSKYNVKVTYMHNEHDTAANGILASIRFTSKETQQSLYVDSCYYNETGILQADAHF